MKTRTRWIARVAGISALALSTRTEAATICVSPSGGLCQTAIQAAVNAASPGDIVKVGPGTYYESVLVPGDKHGLQLVGANKLAAIIDPSAYFDRGTTNGPNGVTILARDVQVKNLTIRNGEGAGIHSLGRGTIVEGVILNGADFVGIQLEGWYGRVAVSEVRNTRFGVQSWAFGAIVRGNLIAGVTYGILLHADGNEATGNKIQNGTHGVVATGDGIVIKTNDVRHQSTTGIEVLGSFPTVVGNQVYGGGATAGILATCTSCFGGTVSSNVVTNTLGDAILVSADDVGLVVQGNTIRRTGYGTSLNGFGILARQNKATDVGRDIRGDCFEVFGSTHTLARNAATRCSKAGIYVNGSESFLEANVTLDTFENGITIDGAVENTLAGNRVTGSAAQGIALINGADGTSVVGNVATRNRVDFCHDGTNTVLSGNTFPTSADTGGTDCVIAH
jgi:parallel beta-helix repeat protein